MDFTNTRRYGDVAETQEERDTFMRTTNSGYGGKYITFLKLRLLKFLR